MILWQGAGILAVLIPLLVWGAGEKALRWMFGDVLLQACPGAAGVLVCLTGLAIWFFGKRLNRRRGDLPASFEAGQSAAVPKKKHAVLFIPIEYIGILWAFIGIYLVSDPKWAVPWLYMTGAGSAIRDGAKTFFWAICIIFLLVFSRQLFAVVTAIAIGAIVTGMAQSFGFSEKTGFIIGMAVFFQLGLVDLLHIFGVGRQKKNDPENRG